MGGKKVRGKTRGKMNNMQRWDTVVEGRKLIYAEDKKRRRRVATPRQDIGYSTCNLGCDGSLAL